jgi:glutamate synthase domain-containing protein 1
MCGITGLFAKNEAIETRLGAHLASMLVTLADRGPDSTGFAIYGPAVSPGTCKVSLRARDGEVDWPAVVQELAGEAVAVDMVEHSALHAVLLVGTDPTVVAAVLRSSRPDLHVLSVGSSIELFKDVGRPEEVIARFDLASRSGSHALGHTRMATESRVTIAGSHPFSTGPDLCLVHNGSLSNHNRLRREMRREGLEFVTENDTEVAAAYLTWRQREGATLEEALYGCLERLDGFYTFAVATIDGFAVLRDPIACKPAILAETDAWVAMATEYRAIAALPGAEDAVVWEPAPGEVYHWGRVPVAT